MTRADLISLINGDDFEEPVESFTTDDLFIIWSTQSAMAKLNMGLCTYGHGSFAKQKKALFYTKAEVESDD